MGQGIDHRVVDRRRRADGARLTDALGPQRITEGRRLGVGRLEEGELRGAGHGVVGQVGREGIAVVVEDHLLPQGLRHPLGDATVLLTGHQQGIDDAPAVVDRDMTDRIHLARLHIDLDHRHVGSEGERGAILGEVDSRRQRAEGAVVTGMAVAVRGRLAWTVTTVGSLSILQPTHQIRFPRLDLGVFGRARRVPTRTGPGTEHQRRRAAHRR